MLFCFVLFYTDTSGLFSLRYVRTRKKTMVARARGRWYFDLEQMCAWQPDFSEANPLAHCFSLSLQPCCREMCERGRAAWVTLSSSGSAAAGGALALSASGITTTNGNYSNWDKIIPIKAGYADRRFFLR